MSYSGKWILGSGASVAAICAGLMLPFSTYQNLLAALCILAGVTAALILQTRNHVWGLAALVVTAALLPLEFRASAGGRTLAGFLLLTAFICVSWLVEIVVLRRRTSLDSSRVVIAALTFMSIAVISFAAGQFPWFSSPAAPIGAQVAGLGLFLLSGGLFLAVGHQVRDVADLKKLTWLFLGAGAALCIADVFPYLGVASRWTKPDSIGSSFWTWLVALGFSQAAINRSLSLPVRVFLFGLTALALFRGLFQATSWVSGWLPPLVAAGIVLLFGLPRIAISLSLLAVPVGLYLSKEALTLLMLNEQYSYKTRLEAWRIVWQIVEKNPLLGVGPANYYSYSQNFPILGWHVSFSSHNNYMDLLAQTGFLGLLAFCWLMIEIFRMIFRQGVRVPADFPRAYVVGALAGLSGTLVSGMFADWIIPFYYNIGIRGFRSSLLCWLFLGGILALKRMHFEMAETETASPGQMRLSRATSGTLHVKW